MPISKVDLNSKFPIKAWATDLADNTLEQLRNTASLPFIHHHVAAMADTHYGLGATVGSVVPTVGAIVPAAVGVDIGCGMMAVKTSLTASDVAGDGVLAKLRAEIEKRVPHGRNKGGLTDPGTWKGVYPYSVVDTWNILYDDFDQIIKKNPKLIRRGKAVERGINQLGTLGTGNHFIELCLDETDALWIVLHSGSRGIGHAIGSYFIQVAQDEMSKWLIDLPDKNLAYLPQYTPQFSEYIEGMLWAQDYARLNRELMMHHIVQAIETVLHTTVVGQVEAINCHHNYAEMENHYGKHVWVTRKGAIRARDEDFGIIPGSMGTASYIVKGKGNKESFCSASHGAGRKMSRRQARDTFTESDLAAQTAGIECRKDRGVLDEIPAAYKPIDEVMAAQTDLVDIVHTLRQIVNVKG